LEKRIDKHKQND